MICFAALNFILWIVLARVMRVSFVGDIFFVHLYYLATDMASLRVPSHVISDFEIFRPTRLRLHLPQRSRAFFKRSTIIFACKLTVKDREKAFERCHVARVSHSHSAASCRTNSQTKTMFEHVTRSEVLRIAPGYPERRVTRRMHDGSSSFSKVRRQFRDKASHLE